MRCEICRQIIISPKRFLFAATVSGRLINQKYVYKYNNFYVRIKSNFKRYFQVIQTERKSSMEKRVALLSIIVKDAEAVESLNRLLHEYADYIIGRQGIPYREKNIHIISVAMDAPTDEINALCGRIGRISGVNSKVVYANE